MPSRLTQVAAAQVPVVKVSNFLERLACRKEEVKRRCRTALQSRAEQFLRRGHADSHHPANAHPTLALVQWAVTLPRRPGGASPAGSPSPSRRRRSPRPSP